VSSVVRWYASGTQQYLDGAALVHSAVGLGDLRQRQFEVEYLPRLDLPVQTRFTRSGKSVRSS
jgi:hypothetical protein